MKKLSTVNNEVLRLLEELSNCGAVIGKEHKGNKAMKKVKKVLTEQEYFDLSIARSHHQIGEGYEEFYYLMGKLKQKYKHERSTNKK